MQLDQCPGVERILELLLEHTFILLQGIKIKNEFFLLSLSRLKLDSSQIPLTTVRCNSVENYRKKLSLRYRCSREKKLSQRELCKCSNEYSVLKITLALLIKTVYKIKNVLWKVWKTPIETVIL